MEIKGSFFGGAASAFAGSLSFRAMKVVQIVARCTERQESCVLRRGKARVARRRVTEKTMGSNIDRKLLHLVILVRFCFGLLGPSTSGTRPVVRAVASSHRSGKDRKDGSVRHLEPAVPQESATYMDLACFRFFPFSFASLVFACIFACLLSRSADVDGGNRLYNRPAHPALAGGFTRKREPVTTGPRARERGLRLCGQKGGGEKGEGVANEGCMLMHDDDDEFHHDGGGHIRFRSRKRPRSQGKGAFPLCSRTNECPAIHHLCQHTPHPRMITVYIL